MLRKTTMFPSPTGLAGQASMRPEHDAPENLEAGEALGVVLQLASMRPEHDAPENQGQAQLQSRSAGASMRPEHDAPENDRLRPRRLVVLTLLQ